MYLYISYTIVQVVATNDYLTEKICWIAPEKYVFIKS